MAQGKGISPEARAAGGGPVVSFGPYRLFPGRHLLSRDGRPVAIGSRALDILIALSERPGELLSKEQLVGRAWPNTIVEESNLRAQIAALRRALADDGISQAYVATIPGRGYRFIAPVEYAATSDAPAFPGRLPVRLAPLIGRDESIASIGARLKRLRFVSIVGAGGIGKTTIAIAIANRLSDAFEDGVVFVDLGPVAHAALAPAALGTALGLPVASNDPLPAIIAFLQQKRVLVVLDSCEHVADRVAVLAEQLLRGAPAVHLLITSREPLRAEGEYVERLSPLETPSSAVGLGAAEALSYSAVRLFVEHAKWCIRQVERNFLGGGWFTEERRSAEDLEP
jgi:DNA-binding winged helix-turn-helix (wHTH) protein